VVAALSVTGFDVPRFTFVGFLPRGKDARKFLAQFDDEIVVFFESPRRIKGTLSYINEIAPLAQICLCNDISKKFERVYRGDAATIFDDLGESGSAEKGEYVCVVKFPAKPVVVDTISIEARLVDVLVKSGGTLKDASRILGEIAPELPKREIYAARLRLRELFG
jgi:16S rRNA (cytidine1402-2'-O)-methyltransferase